MSSIDSNVFTTLKSGIISDQTSGASETTSNTGSTKYFTNIEHRSTVATGSENISDSTPSYDFICTQTGRFPDDSDETCSRYFLCSKLHCGEFIKTAYNCPGLSIFDPSLGRCSKSYACPRAHITQATMASSVLSSKSDFSSIASSLGTSKYTDINEGITIDSSYSTKQHNLTITTELQEKEPTLPNERHTTSSSKTTPTANTEKDYSTLLPETEEEDATTILQHITTKHYEDLSTILTVLVNNSTTSLENQSTLSSYNNSQTIIVSTTESDESSFTSSEINAASTKREVTSTEATEDGHNTQTEAIPEANTEESFSSTAILPTKTTTSKPANEYVCTQSGRFPDDADLTCKRYFLCTLLNTGEFVKTLYYCPGISSFDPNLQKCSDRFVCPRSVTESNEVISSTIRYQQDISTNTLRTSGHTQIGEDTTSDTKYATKQDDSTLTTMSLEKLGSSSKSSTETNTKFDYTTPTQLDEKQTTLFGDKGVSSKHDFSTISTVVENQTSTQMEETDTTSSNDKSTSSTKHDQKQSTLFEENYETMSSHEYTEGIKEFSTVSTVLDNEASTSIKEGIMSSVSTHASGMISTIKSEIKSPTPETSKANDFTTESGIAKPTDKSTESTTDVLSSSSTIQSEHTPKITSTTLAEEFVCPETGRFPDYTDTTCKRYFLCSQNSNGEITKALYHCPGTSFFDPKLQKCTDSFVCTRYTTKETATTESARASPSVGSTVKDPSGELSSITNTVGSSEYTRFGEETTTDSREQNYSTTAKPLPGDEHTTTTQIGEKQSTLYDGKTAVTSSESLSTLLTQTANNLSTLLEEESTTIAYNSSTELKNNDSTLSTKLKEEQRTTPFGDERTTSSYGSPITEINKDFSTVSTVIEKGTSTSNEKEGSTSGSLSTAYNDHSTLLTSLEEKQTTMFEEDNDSTSSKKSTTEKSSTLSTVVEDETSTVLEQAGTTSSSSIIVTNIVSESEATFSTLETSRANSTSSTEPVTVSSTYRSTENGQSDPTPKWSKPSGSTEGSSNSSTTTENAESEKSTSYHSTKFTEVANTDAPNSSISSSPNQSQSTLKMASTTREVEEFVCSESGRFPDYTDTTCKRYFLCSQNPNGDFKKTLYYCPGISSFDPKLQKCTDSFVCSRSTTKETATTEPAMISSSVGSTIRDHPGKSSSTTNTVSSSEYTELAEETTNDSGGQYYSTTAKLEEPSTLPGDENTITSSTNPKLSTQLKENPTTLYDRDTAITTSESSSTKTKESSTILSAQTTKALSTSLKGESTTIAYNTSTELEINYSTLSTTVNKKQTTSFEDAVTSTYGSSSTEINKEFSTVSTVIENETSTSNEKEGSTSGRLSTANNDQSTVSTRLKEEQTTFEEESNITSPAKSTKEESLTLSTFVDDETSTLFSSTLETSRTKSTTSTKIETVSSTYGPTENGQSVVTDITPKWPEASSSTEGNSNSSTLPENTESATSTTYKNTKFTVGSTTDSPYSSSSSSPIQSQSTSKITSTTLVKEFVCSEDGRFPDYTDTTCKRYFLCSQNPNGEFTKTVYYCPGISFFDPKLQKCTESFVCSRSTTTTTESGKISSSVSSTIIYPQSDSTTNSLGTSEYTKLGESTTSAYITTQSTLYTEETTISSSTNSTLSTNFEEERTTLFGDKETTIQHESTGTGTEESSTISTAGNATPTPNEGEVTRNDSSRSTAITQNDPSTLSTELEEEPTTLLEEEGTTSSYNNSSTKITDGSSTMTTKNSPFTEASSTMSTGKVLSTTLETKDTSETVIEEETKEPTLKTTEQPQQEIHCQKRGYFANELDTTCQTFYFCDVMGDGTLFRYTLHCPPSYLFNPSTNLCTTNYSCNQNRKMLLNISLNLPHIEKNLTFFSYL